MPSRRVTQKPIVIAGLKWPPEMCPMAETMMAIARPCASAIPSRPMPGSPEARRNWFAQMEPTPKKIKVNVPKNSAMSFCGLLYTATPPNGGVNLRAV